MNARFQRNKRLLCMALLLNQSAYVTLESLQSSLNQSKGTSALAVLYTCFVLSALLLPSFVTEKFGCKKTIACSISSYELYIAANFYPSPYTLIPTAALLGVGAGILWSTVFAYITRMSGDASKNNFEEFKRINKETFATFFSFVHCSLLVGSLVMIAMLVSASFIERKFHDNANSTALNISEKVNKTCGLFNDNTSPHDNKAALNISDPTLYLILSGFFLLNGVSIFLSLCLNDYPDNTFSDHEGTESQLDKDVQLSVLLSNKEDDKANEPDKHDPPDKAKEMKNEKLDEHPTTRLKSTLKLLVSDLVAVLILPHTIHIGMYQAFVRATFFGSWISCSYGLNYVSYMMLAYALSMVMSSYLSVKLLSVFGHRVLFGGALFLELIALSTLLLWHTSDPSWLFFLLSIAFGCSRSLLKTQTPSCFASLFPHQQVQAASLQTSSESIGVAVTYGLMSILLPIHVIVLLGTMSLLAYLLFIVSTLIQTKQIRILRQSNSHVIS